MAIETNQSPDLNPNDPTSSEGVSVASTNTSQETTPDEKSFVSLLGELWNGMVEKQRLIAVASAIGTMVAVLALSGSPENSTPAPEPTPVESLEPEQLTAKDVNLIPEEITVAQIMAEWELNKLVENNNTGVRSTKEPSEVSTNFWRGVLMFETRGTDGKPIYGMMNNPLEMWLDGSIYYVAYHEDTAQLITILAGAVRSDGRIGLTDRESKISRFAVASNPFSGQRVSGSPMSYDFRGIKLWDNHEKVVRDNDNYYYPTVELFTDRETALSSLNIGRELDIYNKADQAYTSRDHLAVQADEQ
ncbi:MAG: hypothetical protein WDZ81_00235 [Candidatus Saccharimonadales bacterium]